MGEVVNLPVDTYLDLPVRRILDSAIEADLDQVVVIGWDKEGRLYLATSKSDKAEILWLLEVAKKQLFDAGNE